MPRSFLRLRGHLRRYAFVLSLFAVAVDASAAPMTSVEKGIRATMDASAVAWTAGDLDRFMDSYEDSQATVAIGARGTIHGKAAIRETYAPRFVDGKPGKLGFDILEIRPLGPGYALLIGRFHLQPTGGDQAEATGLFSLIFHRRAGAWRIVCDHTS